MINVIYEGTQKLASDNAVTLTKKDIKPLDEKRSIIDLKRYLLSQKEIFEKAS